MGPAVRPACDLIDSYRSAEDQLRVRTTCPGASAHLRCSSWAWARPSWWSRTSPTSANLVRTYLAREGYTVIWVRSGEEALTELGRHPDRAWSCSTSDCPGSTASRCAGESPVAVPVIMLTARDEEPDRVAGLEVGADDYVSKPFSPRELTARVKAVLRRAAHVAGSGAPSLADVTQLGPVTLARGAREVRVDGREVELTQREFDLLEYLLRHAGQVVTRDQLLETVWGFRSPGRDANRRGSRRPAAQEARPPGADPNDPRARLQGDRMTMRGSGLDRP